MSRPLKKSIKNNVIVKVKKKGKKSYRQIWSCIVKRFFIAIVANSTITLEYASLAQT